MTISETRCILKKEKSTESHYGVKNVSLWHTFISHLIAKLHISGVTLIPMGISSSLDLKTHCSNLSSSKE
jgi:hypothetical protein